MKPRYIILSSLFAFLSSLAVVFAHELEQSTWQRIGIPDPYQILSYSAAIMIIALVLAAFLKNEMSKNLQKIAYFAIAIPVIIGTLYLGWATIELNQKSWSHGPVHWHADFEIWVCGEQIDIVNPTGLRNFVGEEAIHEHGDNRIHIEGVIFDREDATLHEFFEALGGEFTESTLSVPTEHGMETWKNRDSCNGIPGVWYTFINNGYAPSKEAVDYVISPWQTVPPGDTIKFVFSEKNLEEINPKIGAPP